MFLNIVMALAFSSSEQAAIDRKVDAQKSDYFEDRDYEVRRCCNWISENNFKIVTLQFPDTLLPDACRVLQEIKAICPDVQLFILADTSYGSCCVDEVAANHVAADAVIHFGHSCGSPASRLPILCVPAARRRVQGVAAAVSHLVAGRRLALVCQAEYKHMQESIASELRQEFSDNFRGCFDRVSSVASDIPLTVVVGRHRAAAAAVTSCSGNDVVTFDPEVGMARPLAELRKRLRHTIEVIKDARVVGILVGTLGVKDYLCGIEHVKTLVRGAGKKCYTIVVGKVNVEKLANIPDVDVFVLVGCPEMTVELAEESRREYFRPIVTPWQVELALNTARKGVVDSEEDLMNFRQLLAGSERHVTPEYKPDSDTDISLLTGKLRDLQPLQPTASDASVRWRGLEEPAESTEKQVSAVTEGESGLAVGYSHERTL